MPLPRNLQHKNKATHKKLAKFKETNRKATELNQLCDKHKVGEMELKNCKLATEDGTVTFVENNDKLKANLRAGVILVKADALTESKEVVYDLVKIAKDRKERMDKKKAEDDEKARNEIERLQKQEADATQNKTPETLGTEDENLLKKLIDEEQKLKNEMVDDEIIDDDVDRMLGENSELVESANQTTDSAKQPNETETQDKISIEDILAGQSENEQRLSEDVPEGEHCHHEGEHCHHEGCDSCGEGKRGMPEEIGDKGDKKESASDEKRRKALEQMKKLMEQKAKAKEGNKYFRNFMKDLKSKFTLKENSSLKYFEVREGVTDLIIENSKVYEIVMPAQTKEKYLLVVGDLQKKSQVIRRIDPTYRAENLLKDQFDFLERIKAKENAKTTAHSEDIIDDLDDLDDLSISDDEEDAPDLVPVGSQNATTEFLQTPKEILETLMNPDLIKATKLDEV